MLSGFTIVRNAVVLDYPVVPAIRSLLDICDEVVVNVGRSDDATRELVTAIGDPRVRVLDTVWDTSRAGGTLATETDRAMRSCRGPWGIYIQADEVLHETGAAMLRDQVRACDGDAGVQGLLVDYVHFYGDVDTVATNRHWYRREVRAVRLGGAVRSYGDAQGFRAGPEHARVRARATGARMFHYGWARPPAALARKHAAFKELFQESFATLERREAAPTLEWTPGLCRFTGTHPQAAADWIAAQRAAAAGRQSPIAPRRLRPSDLRFYVSDWIERATGARVFEHRNYELV
jgi:hypothetical protein